jgi:hypothetical protein
MTSLFDRGSNEEGTSDSIGFTGAESFLVGICPHYWAFIPMTIADVQTLKVVDGVYCATVEDDNDNQDYSSRSRDATRRNRIKLIPVSKCQLVGILVNIKINSNGSTLYVLDDGTGMIDCMAWTNEGNDDKYMLPSLHFDDPSESVPKHYKIGDQVRIFGKIHCVAFGSSESDDQETLVVVAGKQLQFKQSLREVQVSSMERIRPTSLDAEARHWMSCQNSVLAPASKEATPRNSSQLESSAYSLFQQKRKRQRRLQNANDVLDLLGHTIQSQVDKEQKKRSSTTNTSNDPCLAAWRVFGASCPCSLPYMDSLLYCHCQAKKEPLDPSFKFRDAVLAVMLEMEEQWSLNNDDVAIDGADTDANTNGFRFYYKQIVWHDRLRENAAKRVMGSAEMTTIQPVDQSSTNVNRLFRQTFSALRQDGIIYLEDMRADCYLLLSRKHVLGPFVKRELEKSSAVNGATAASPRKAFLNLESAPPFLSNVPFQRLLYLRRTQVTTP